MINDFIVIIGIVNQLVLSN